MKLGTQERVYISQLFNKGGYVLDFSTLRFDDFTESCIGIRLTEKYRVSKGASLEKYILDFEAEEIVVLLDELLEYAITTDDFFEIKNINLVKKVRGIINKYKTSSTLPQLTISFSSQYISQMASSMYASVDNNPTDAIGKAKELIECCCKTILERMGLSYKKGDDLSVLMDSTITALHLSPRDISDTAKEVSSIRALLGNLRAISTNMATLRNVYGGGHGKSATYIGLEPRHAKLAVGCSVALVNFLWETYEKTAV